MNKKIEENKKKMEEYAKPRTGIKWHNTLRHSGIPANLRSSSPAHVCFETFEID